MISFQENPPMPTECIPDLFGFARVEGRAVVASFDGGAITTDAGGLLLGTADRAIRLVERFASCFKDARCAALTEREMGLQAPTVDGDRAASRRLTNGHGS